MFAFPTGWGAGAGVGVGAVGVAVEFPGELLPLQADKATTVNSASHRFVFIMRGEMSKLTAKLKSLNIEHLLTDGTDTTEKVYKGQTIGGYFREN